MNHSTMKESALIKAVLLLSGLVATGIAVTILLAPDAFYASYGIDLGNDVNLANELKAPGGVLLVTGLLMLVGAFRSEFTFVSTVTATTIYLSYGLSRLLSMAIDGVPNSALIGATFFELFIGTICLLALLPFRKTRKQQI